MIRRYGREQRLTLVEHAAVGSQAVDDPRAVVPVFVGPATYLECPEESGQRTLVESVERNGAYGIKANEFHTDVQG
jgi:hypothetical protein